MPYLNHGQITHSDRLEELHEHETEWSVSRLQTIFSCGKKYHYKYIDKVEEFPGPPLAFGTAIHRTVETLHLTNNWDDSFMQRTWSDEWYEASTVIDWDKTQYRKSTYDAKGPKILEAYTLKHKGDQWLGLEVTFRTAVGEGLPILRGAFDKVQRLTEHPDVPPEFVGRLAVIDYKTSKNSPDPLLLSVDPQLIIYYKAFKELTGEDIVVGLHWLPGEIVESKNPTPTIFWKAPKPQDFDNIVVPMLKRGIERVEKKEFERNVSWNCRYCPFKQQCLGGLSAAVEVNRSIS